jgi:hypothetical protein
MSRYDGKQIIVNNDERYSDYLRNRGVNHFSHYVISKLKYPSIDDLQSLQNISIIWSQEDRLWKLSQKYYGDPTLWYIIGFMNKKPTDQHISIGDIIYVFFPLEQVFKLTGLG